MASTKWSKMMARLTIFIGMLLSLAAQGQVKIEGIEFSSLPGDKVEIRMHFDGVPPTPTGYTIEQPARIALDLKDVVSGLDSKYHALGNGNARNVTVIEAKGRTRLIVSLTELVTYTTEVVGNDLIVLVGKQSVENLVARTSGIVAKVDSARESQYNNVDSDLPEVEEIDFRRGEDGEGRVIVKLSNAGQGVDVSSEGGKIRVEFSNTRIPSRLQRKLDVTDFATPVLFVDALAESENTILMIEPVGDYDYLAYQADNEFTLEVKSLSQAEAEASRDAAFRFRGEKLSLNFQDIEIRAILQLIADTEDLNLVASDSVSGRITLRLKNVPWDQALEIIMKTKGLDKRLVGSVLMVAPAEELAAREKLELESKQQISALAPLRTEFIEVKYAIASEIFDLFQGSENGGGEGVVSSRGSVIVDERTNSIILTETVERINEFRAVLEKLDVPVRQVLIEARIVTASTNFSEALGVRWGGLGFGFYDDGNIFTQTGGSLDTVGEVRDSISDPDGISFSSPDHLLVNLGVASADATKFAVGIVDKKYLLDLEISALETQGNAEVIARPKVITSDKQEATISSGVEIPYQEASSSGAATTQFKSATLELLVKPQITPDDRIIMELNVKQDTVGAVFNGVPSINTNSVKTKVLVSNGETIVLGGIFTTRAIESVTKTPFFGDLPFLGKLFRRTTQTDGKEELLIFITPRLINDELSK